MGNPVIFHLLPCMFMRVLKLKNIIISMFYIVVRKVGMPFEKNVGLRGGQHDDTPIFSLFVHITGENPSGFLRVDRTAYRLFDG
jgi:hypothetical protein